MEALEQKQILERLLEEEEAEFSKGASVKEVIQNVECYERAFRKFVDARETYLRFEVNEGMINVANESYKKEKENKFLLDVELSTWKSKMKSATKEMSKSDHKSRRSSKTGKSSINRSVRESVEYSKKHS